MTKGGGAHLRPDTSLSFKASFASAVVRSMSTLSANQLNVLLHGYRSRALQAVFWVDETSGRSTYLCLDLGPTFSSLQRPVVSLLGLTATVPRLAANSCIGCRGKLARAAALM
jgi:hypothetical protein